MKFVIDAFENEICKAINSKAVVATCNGWSALYAVMLSLDLEKDAEVITTPFTFQATINAIIAVGAKPVFVDISEYDHLINVANIEQAITDKTRVIMPVHLFGRPCDMRSIMRIADKHNLIVVEDAAQSFLAQYNEEYLGTLGHFGCFSFYATKNLSTFEGGAVSINRDVDKYEPIVRATIHYGQTERYKHSRFGFNGRMSAQSALTGYSQLKLHKNQIEHSLGEYNENNGYYPYLCYEHDFMKRLGISGKCPIAEKVVQCIRTC